MAVEDGIEMRGMMARWDALRAHWALTDAEEAQLLGGGGLDGPVGQAASWHAPRMEQRMRLLIDLGGALEALLMDGARTRRWLRRPLESLGSLSPIEAMATSPEWIRRFIASALDFVA